MCPIRDLNTFSPCDSHFCTSNERAKAAGGGVVREPWHHGLVDSVLKVPSRRITGVFNGQKYTNNKETVQKLEMKKINTTRRLRVARPCSARRLRSTTSLSHPLDVLTCSWKGDVPTPWNSCRHQLMMSYMPRTAGRSFHEGNPTLVAHAWAYSDRIFPAASTLISLPRPSPSHWPICR